MCGVRWGRAVNGSPGDSTGPGSGGGGVGRVLVGAVVSYSLVVSA